ncbi:MAG TPA: YcxB family protein [Bacilli bacterium]|nr:YcxB family protein [Bacilli bacterium]
MNKIVIKSQYSKKVHLAFYKFHMFRKSTKIYFIMLIGVFTLYLAIKYSTSAEMDPTNLMIIWALAAFSILLTPVIMMTRTGTIVRQEAKERLETVELLEITKDRILRKVENAGSVVTGWYNINSVYETKDAFYFYLSAEQGLVLVKKDIITGDVDSLREMITKNLKPNKKGKIPFKKYFKEKK